MATWEKVNGPQVVPPVYEKKVGRPRKSRRKQPYEVKGTHGTKMSRHGVIIRCGYCKGENHNAKGCSLKQKGLRPHDIVPDVPPVAEEESFHNDNDNVDVPPYDVQLHEEIPMTANASQPTVLTQDSQQDSQPAMLLSQMTSTMLMRMMEQVNLVNSKFCNLIQAPSITNNIFLAGCAVRLLHSACWASASLQLHQLKPTGAKASCSNNSYQRREDYCKEEERSQGRQGCTT